MIRRSIILTRRAADLTCAAADAVGLGWEAESTRVLRAWVALQAAAEEYAAGVDPTGERVAALRADLAKRHDAAAA